MHIHFYIHVLIKTHVSAMCVCMCVAIEHTIRHYTLRRLLFVPRSVVISHVWRYIRIYTVFEYGLYSNY